MTSSAATETLAAELRRIAPEIPFEEIDPTEDLRDAFEIDSMDFLTLVTSLGKRLDIEIPEADYPCLDTLEHAIAYLEERGEAQR